MVHATLEFLIRNNVTIIQFLFGFLFLLLIFLIVRSFKEPSQSEAISKPVKSKVKSDAAKEKILEKRESKVEIPMDSSPLDDLDNLEDLVGAPSEKSDEPSSTPAAPQAPAEALAPVTPVVSISPEKQAEMDKALAEKESTINNLKTEIEQLRKKAQEPQATPQNTADLESKIKELSDKLAEYEIIEEDIANLSFYKTENQKLKEELEKLKSNDGLAAAAILAAEAEAVPKSQDPVPVQEPVAVSVPAPEAPVKVDPSPSEVNPGDVLSATPEPEPFTNVAQAPSDVPSPAVKEFEKTIEQKETLEKTVPLAPSDQSGIDADILKEFENVVQKEWGGGSGASPENSSAAPVADSALTNTQASNVPEEKATASGQSEASPTAVNTQPDASSESQIDSEKLMQEVEAMASESKEPSNTSPQTEDESKQKLIAEFENFINKAQ